MWILKGCNRCRGDMFVSRDEYGWHGQCLQCSYQGYVDILTEIRKLQGEIEKERALAIPRIL